MYVYEGLPIRQIIVEIEIEIGIGIDPVLFCTWPSEHRSNFTAELCQHRNNTVAVPGFSCPNPITRSFDSDSNPHLASPWTFSDDRW